MSTDNARIDYLAIVVSELENSWSSEVSQKAFELTEEVLNKVDLLSNVEETDKEYLKDGINSIADKSLPTQSRLDALVEICEYIGNVTTAGMKLSIKIIETLAHCIQCIRECVDLKPVNALKHLKDAVECAKKIPQRAASFVATLKNEREQNSGISVRSV